MGQNKLEQFDEKNCQIEKVKTNLKNLTKNCQIKWVKTNLNNLMKKFVKLNGSKQT